MIHYSQESLDDFTISFLLRFFQTEEASAILGVQNIYTTLNSSKALSFLFYEANFRRDTAWNTQQLERISGIFSSVYQYNLEAAVKLSFPQMLFQSSSCFVSISLRCKVSQFFCPNSKFVKMRENIRNVNVEFFCK